MPQEGDNATHTGSHGARTQTGDFKVGSQGLGDAVGTPSPNGSQPKAEPTLLGTLRAPGPPFPFLLDQSHLLRDLWSPARFSLASTPFSRDMLRINLTPKLCVATIKIIFPPQSGVNVKIPEFLFFF